jgi:hypothetical protein
MSSSEKFQTSSVSWDGTVVRTRAGQGSRGNPKRWPRRRLSLFTSFRAYGKGRVIMWIRRGAKRRDGDPAVPPNPRRLCGGSLLDPSWSNRIRSVT